MARKTRPKTTHEEWWLLTATTAPEDLDSWCALVRLDRERIRAAREALQGLADLNVAELRLHEAGIWFLPLSAAEDIVEDIWQRESVRLTASQAAQVRGAAVAVHEESSGYVTECDELVIWPHHTGAVHWTALPKHGDFTITTSMLDLDPVADAPALTKEATL